MNSLFQDLLRTRRLTEVVDIGTSPPEDEPPYKRMLDAGLCRLTGFDLNQQQPSEDLKPNSDNERYLPYAVGDGGVHTLNVGPARYGMTSFFEPDAQALRMFVGLEQFSEVFDRVPVKTCRLDDVSEIKHIDFLKVEMKGAELAILEAGKQKLSETVVIQTEIPLVPLHKDQPGFGNIDIELRAQGFIPHCFPAIKSWPTTTYGRDGDPRPAYTQLLEADVVYVRDVAHPDGLSDEQLKQLALIAHYCYRSYDLALRCVNLLEQREALEETDAEQRYLDILSTDEKEVLAVEKYQDIAAGVQHGQPRSNVQDSYLSAWELHPGRAEPLYALARQYRVERRFQLGYLFAKSAAEIQRPENIDLVDAAIYDWRIADEQAICAFWIGKKAEAFALCRGLLAQDDLPDDQRNRITGNRDFSVPVMVEAALAYPDSMVRRLNAGPRDARITVSLIAADLTNVERTLNSFLNCCNDIELAERFLVLDAGLSADDRAALAERYRFVELIGSDVGLTQIRQQVGGRLWLHLGEGWQFFAPENYLSRLTAVLDTEREVIQVGINFADATKPIGRCATGEMVRSARDAGRYVMTASAARGPAMFDTGRLDQVSGIDSDGGDLIDKIARAVAASGIGTASLDEVLCTAMTDHHP